jgi:hypothetical protein
MAGTATPQAAGLPPDPLAGDDEQVNQRGEAAKSGLDRILGRLPSLLSSKPVIIFGIFLFCYLFLYAGIASLLGHAGAVTANTQLILGNYTNVSSSVGAGIAAGAGVAILKRQRRAHRITLAAHDAAMEAKAIAEETHRLLRLAFPEHAATLGQVPGRPAERGGRPDAPSGAPQAPPAPPATGGSALPDQKPGGGRPQ